MANPRNPNDPYRSADDPYRSNLTDDEIKRQARLDGELLPDPELGERPASGGKVAMFAIAIALVLGAVFYGMNNSSIIRPARLRPPRTPRTPRRHRLPPAPTGMRDVTPRANIDQGTTTGAAPARPQPPPAPAANPPADNAAPK